MKNQPFTPAWYRIVLHVVLPAGLTILLFLGAIFGMMLPRIKSNFITQKRQLIKELTDNVCALVEHYDQRYQSGELTLAESQQRILERIRAMRYGPEGKDYFWVHNLDPIMIMHPYRLDLEGQDISTLGEAQGKYFILDMNKVVTTTPEHAGYVDYMWQWKDDPNEIAPKLSYVRLYEPWGWVIGTGVYLEDVNAELDSIIRNLERSFILIILVITGIGGYLIWQGVCSEIKRRDNELQREKLMKSLAIKNEELESVVYIASHDLRSPLINLKGFSEELAMSCKQLGEFIIQPDSEEKKKQITNLLNQEIPECLGFIQTNTEKMKGLVEGLLQLSRLGVAELVIERLDMNHLVQQVIQSCQYQIKSNQAQIQIDPLLPCKGDSKLIDQVFSNLIDNAIKYRHPDRKLHIHLTSHKAGRMVEYTISDNGIGIDQRDIEKIFEMFHQVCDGDKCDGVGLGLTIVRRILDMLGGSIRIDSKLEQGTMFIVSLPAG